MGQALYRKYRSKSLEEVVGQEHITTTLQKALASGRISHAYLFSGPRGVGKTSIARILAHEIIGLKYSDDTAHLDIIEIDAASNRRIDEIRELRDKVYITPTSGKYKIYIIDEVHMLTREAFNALLKTLEEPPAHAVFILATTEAHKLPETIVSRTQHFTFRPVEQIKVVNHLKHIAMAEHITIDEPALELLASHGEGSFRDSISLLDQASSLDGSLGVTDVERLLGIAPKAAIEELRVLIKNGALAAVLLHALEQLYGQGVQPARIAHQLIVNLRTTLTSPNTSTNEMKHDLALMRRLIDVPASREPERLLEIILLETAMERTSLRAEAATATAVQTATSKPTPVRPAAAAPAKVRVATAAPLTTMSVAPQEITTPKKVTTEDFANLDETAWPQILASVKKEYNTLYGVLRMAKPSFNGKAIELACTYAFHQKRLNEPKNKKIIADFIKQLTGLSVSITCIVMKHDAMPIMSNSLATASTAPLDTISSIFGGGEIVS